jgi:hypothetical protein
VSKNLILFSGLIVFVRIIKNSSIQDGAKMQTFGLQVRHYVVITAKGKGKAVPLQARTGPEGSRRLRLPDFQTIGT